jgi:serine/threonine protein kinase
VRPTQLDGSLRPRVNNFGLARPPSFLWMAPEVFSKKQYSTAADVFSLGVVLWEIFTSCRPWEGTPPSIAVLRVAKDSARLPLPLAKPNENGTHNTHRRTRTYRTRCLALVIGGG